MTISFTNTSFIKWHISKKCLGHSAPTWGGCAAAKEESGWRMEDGKTRLRADSCARTGNLARNARVLGEWPADRVRFAGAVWTASNKSSLSH
jgi:hypothetical protein